MKRPASSPRIVVAIDEKDDGHLPFVERHLSLPLVVIDPAATMAGEELSYSLRGGKLQITYRGKPLDNVAGVWFRGRWSLSTPSIPLAYQEYAHSAIMRHVMALYTQLQGARWVSRYDAIYRAGYKPLQLQLAAGLGLKVPDTLFTCSPAKAQEFIDSYPVTITKPFAYYWAIETDKNHKLFFYATKIRKGEKVDLSKLPLAPAIFQQAIDAAADLRVTVIGDKVFSAIIIDEKVDPNSRIRDWRMGNERGKLNIQPYKLPKDISDKCIALVKKLGLEYGAIDFVLDKKGQIWFLEINPNGQWAFVEEKTDQPMGKAMADLLQGSS